MVLSAEFFLGKIKKVSVREAQRPHLERNLYGPSIKLDLEAPQLRRPRFRLLSGYYTIPPLYQKQE